MENNFFCTKPVINVLLEPKKSSKVSSQLIYGEKFQIISRSKNYIKVKNFYESIAKDLQINHFFLPEYLDKGKVDKMFYFEGHMNKFGHKVVSEILSFLTNHKIILDENFSVIVNQGPGSFSAIRISLAVAKGLIISKNIKLYGYIFYYSYR